MPKPVLYYIRHGETDWNALGKLQGTQDVPINARGQQQAVQAGDILSGLLSRDGRNIIGQPKTRRVQYVHEACVHFRCGPSHH